MVSDTNEQVLNELTRYFARVFINLFIHRVGRKVEESETYERPRVHGSRQSRQTSQAWRWSRKCWWHAAHENLVHEEVSENLGEANLFLLYSHPGYFGKKGQRHFHLKRNQYHMPTINLDKLWSLVSDESRKVSTESKAIVIDVVKSVSSASPTLFLLIIIAFSVL